MPPYRVSDVFTVTPSASDLQAGVIGLWFTTAGTATVTTIAGNSVSVGGVVGTFFECPIRKVTAATATVLGVIGR